MAALLALTLLATAPLTALPPLPVELYRIAWNKPLVAPQLLEWKPREPGGPAVDRDTGMVVVGTRDGALRAIGSDGNVRWELTTNGPFDAPPLIDRGVVYAGSDDGYLYALELTTGKELWRYEAREEVGTTPVISGGLVMVATLQDTVVAVDAKTGTWKWQHRREASDQFTIRGAAGVAVAGGTAYAAHSDGWVVALDAASGVVRWERQVSTSGKYLDVDSTPQVAAGKVYVASYSGTVMALDAASGATRWEVKLPGASRLRLASGLLIAVGTDTLLGLDPNDGRQIWSQPLEGEPAGIPVVMGRLLLVPRVNGLAWLELSSGRRLKVLNPGTGVSATPAMVGRRVYALSNGGNLLALDLP